MKHALYKIVGLTPEGRKAYSIEERDGTVLGETHMVTEHFNLATVAGHPEIPPTKFDNLRLASEWMRSFVTPAPKVDPAVISPEEAERESAA